MSGPLIVIGLSNDDVEFVRDLLADCAAQSGRDHKKAARRSYGEYYSLYKWSGWRDANARRILAEVTRQARACRKEMRETAP